MTALINSVDLSKATLVANGGYRLVYEHLDYPGLLIKVVRPDKIGDDGQNTRKAKRFKIPRRMGGFRQTHREITEFLAFQSKRKNRTAQLPISRIYGFVDTELGLGMLSEKLTGPQGGLAPTLQSLVRSKEFSLRHRDLLEAFFQDVEKNHICLTDLTPANIVFAGNKDADGRFVAIDGLGCKTLIPLRDWSALFNTFRTRRNARKIWRFVDQCET